MEKTNHPQDPEKKEFSLKPQQSASVQLYAVKAGDTLTSIAKKFYGDGAEYLKIYEANKDLIGDSPDNLKVGQELKIPPK